jgi:phosphoribosylamine--glycine ligase
VNYRGILYAGLMLTRTGPKLIEFNVRFGDPETQVVVPLLADDLYDVLYAAASGRINEPPVFRAGAAVTVVLAAGGYPGTPSAGDVIEGLGADGQLLEPVEGVTVFHAGTRLDDDGRFVTAGGRVLAISAVGDSLDEARQRAYEGAGRVTFAGRQMRGDIAAKYLEGAR